METLTNFDVPRKKLQGLLQDAEKSAKIINLVYVSDKAPGIHRVRRGKKLLYLKNGKLIRDKKILDRIKKLVIPPAWTDVWICLLPNGHLQATGTDVKKRKQYRYHPQWNEFRNQTKFFQLLSFGRRLPAIRKQLEQDLSRPGLPVEKVLAAVVMIMEQTNIRVGNSVYEKLYGSFGLTTLKDKHVKINGNSVRFCFRGKKGVYHQIDMRSKKLARIVKQCRDIPGKELFQYYDENGARRSIDSGMVNEYLKSICCENFTTKDFRTWMGTVHAIEVLTEIGGAESPPEVKRNIVTALDRVAERLGNTRAVCKKYYVHPAVLGMYEDQTLGKYFTPGNSNEEDGFSAAERILLQILEKM